MQGDLRVHSGGVGGLRGRRLLSVHPEAPEPEVATQHADTVATDVVSASLLSPQLRGLTVGIVAVITLVAFEGMGVMTAMPVAVRELNGLGAYAWAFNGYIVTTLVAMVVSGQQCDAIGPRRPLIAAIVLFCIGAVIAGTAPSMVVFVAGRMVQGMGGGALIVAVYVVIGRVFPDSLKPRAFSALAAAWVLPALIGPVLAGFLADHVSWRAVFLLVPFFALPPLLVLVPRLRGHDGPIGDITPRVGHTRAALVAGLGLIALQSASERRGWLGIALAAVGVVILVPSARHLLPAGSLRFARGLPTVISLRGVIAGAFFGAEAFVPLALHDIRGVSTTLAGMAIAIGSLAWTVSSAVQGSSRVHLSRVMFLRIGTALAATCLATVPLSLVSVLPPWLAVVSWAIGAAGMGFAFPSLSVLTLRLSPPADQGANSAALQVSDSMGSVVLLAAAGTVHAAAVANGGATESTYTLIWLSMAVIMLVAMQLSRRVAVRAA